MRIPWFESTTANNCEANEATWKECNKRLFNYYQTLALQLPESFAEMEPLFLAVICGCNAGLFREALHEVYIPRIQRADAHFAANVLGATGPLLSALGHFFERGRWGSLTETAIERVHALAQEQNDAALMLAAYGAFAVVFYFMGEFNSSRKYARDGVQIWRSGSVQSPVTEEHLAPVVNCLISGAMSAWHFGEIASCHALMDEAISTAKELKDRNALVLALNYAAALAVLERDPLEVDRLASEMIELSTRNNFVYWLALGVIYRGWARSASGNIAEGIPGIEQGIKDLRATGQVLGLPFHLARKAEALYLADRNSEALETINEAVAIAERFEHGYHSAELHRLRGVFLATLGAEELRIEASFCKPSESQRSRSRFR
jgi:hypothetical protein